MDKEFEYKLKILQDESYDIPSYNTTNVEDMKYVYETTVRKIENRRFNEYFNNFAIFLLYVFKDLRGMKDLLNLNEFRIRYITTLILTKDFKRLKIFILKF